MFCLDWQELGLEIYGSWDKGNIYQAIDIVAFPCATRLSPADDIESQNCNWDKNAAIDYIGDTGNLLVFFN